MNGERMTQLKEEGSGRERERERSHAEPFRLSISLGLMKFCAF